MNQDWQYPTQKELDEIHYRATLMRNQAIRESFGAFVQSLRASVTALFGAKTTTRDQNA